MKNFALYALALLLVTAPMKPSDCSYNVPCEQVADQKADQYDDAAQPKSWLEYCREYKWHIACGAVVLATLAYAIYAAKGGQPVVLATIPNGDAQTAASQTTINGGTTTETPVTPVALIPLTPETPAPIQITEPTATLSVPTAPAMQESMQPVPPVQESEAAVNNGNILSDLVAKGKELKNATAEKVTEFVDAVLKDEANTNVPAAQPPVSTEQATQQGVAEAVEVKEELASAIDWTNPVEAFKTLMSWFANTPGRTKLDGLKENSPAIPAISETNQASATE